MRPFIVMFAAGAAMGLLILRPEHPISRYVTHRIEEILTSNQGFSVFRKVLIFLFIMFGVGLLSYAAFPIDMAFFMAGDLALYIETAISVVLLANWSHRIRNWDWSSQLGRQFYALFGRKAKGK